MEQLGEKLLFTTLELEKLKSEVSEETRKNKEHVKQIIHLLKCAIQERDEAKTQLHNLLNNETPQFQSDNTLLLRPGKPNSSPTESNSLPETYNYRSPPVESLLDAVSSPDFSNINMVVNQQSFVRESNQVITSVGHQCSVIVDNLVKGRSLPEKGKFLQAVLHAGPLLHMLPVGGPLPRWRNPPLFRPFQVPLVSIKGCDVDGFYRKPASYSQATPMLDLASGTNASSLMNATSYAHLAKRQRFC